MPICLRPCAISLQSPADFFEYLHPITPSHQDVRECQQGKRFELLPDFITSAENLSAEVLAREEWHVIVAAAYICDTGRAMGVTKALTYT
jgi:hypothetical protein